MKYIRDLAKVDDKVMSISPQIGKENRPFVGIVVICDSKPYCIPLTSPKLKHQQMKNDKDFSKMFDKNGKLIGAINFNNMIPVDNRSIKPIDINVHPKDSPKDKAYKELLNDQLNWCNQNKESIIKKANRLYIIVTETPDKFRNLTRRCCDFKKLEIVLEKRLTKV
jgi:protein AbiQ